jgi:hypothetical protein
MCMPVLETVISEGCSDEETSSFISVQMIGLPIYCRKQHINYCTEILIMSFVGCYNSKCAHCVERLNIRLNFRPAL